MKSCKILYMTQRNNIIITHDELTVKLLQYGGKKLKNSFNYIQMEELGKTKHLAKTSYSEQRRH